MSKAISNADTAPPENKVLSLILNGPIASTLLRLAAPNIVGFLVMAAVTMAEMWFVGQLGTSALAGLALSFPMVMLMQMLSAGSVGGIIAATTARALGAGDVRRANAIIWHAVGIAIIASIIFTVVFLIFGSDIYRAVGGNDENVRQATLYSNALFSGVIAVWLFNILASLLRGSGDMQTPARTMIVVALVQVLCSGGLSQGWLGLPNMGIAGIGWGMVIASTVGIFFVFKKLASGKASIHFDTALLRFDSSIMKELLKVGVIATLNPFLSVASVVLLTSLVSGFGETVLAGFGIGARLEFILVPIVFGLGAAMISLVGSNIGAGQIKRAEKIGWTGGAMAAFICGAIGLLVGLVPASWAGLFTDDADVYAASAQYLIVVGPSYLFFGLGLSLYFASQGAHAVIWPVLASVGRLIVAIGIGTWVIDQYSDYSALLYCVAGSLFTYGLFASLPLALGAWRRANRHLSTD